MPNPTVAIAIHTTEPPNVQDQPAQYLFSSTSPPERAPVVISHIESSPITKIITGSSSSILKSWSECPCKTTWGDFPLHRSLNESLTLIHLARPLQSGVSSCVVSLQLAVSHNKHSPTFGQYSHLPVNHCTVHFHFLSLLLTSFSLTPKSNCTHLVQTMYDGNNNHQAHLGVHLSHTV